MTRYDERSTFFRSIASRYRVADGLLMHEGKVPLVYWTNAENFGDLLSPWLLSRMTGHPVALSTGETPDYVAVGSIIKRVGERSIVWGTGSFGTESGRQLCAGAEYRAVRGPLTRAKLLRVGVQCPQVYGDPALLAPLYYYPRVEPTHEVGLVVRWSEGDWSRLKVGPGVSLIYLKSGDIEGTITEMLKCKRIISSSLHGLIIADAYGIPSAWLSSGTPKGGEFKFYDYFISVNKVRHAFTFEFGSGRVELHDVMCGFDFDARPIEFEYMKLLDACPFLRRVDLPHEAPSGDLHAEHAR